MGRCIITQQDIENMFPIVGDYEQAALAMLKNRGAPVRGFTHLALDTDYLFTRRCDNDTGDIVIDWKRAGRGG